MKKILISIALLMSATALMATNTLQVSSNNRYIVNESGDAVFFQNDWAFAMPWAATTGDISTYLNTRAAQGFNVIAIQAIDKNYENDDDYATFENKAGYKPFQLQTSGSYTGRWDLTKPVEGYWNFIDTIIDTANSKGMYVILGAIPVRGCILAGEAIRCMDRDDVNTAYAYGNFLGNRYADKTNIIWLAGFGRAADEWNNVSTTVDAIAKGIADGVNGVSNNTGVTDYSTTLMTYTSERWADSSSVWFNDEDWLDFNTVYDVPGGNGGDQITKITNDYALSTVKPTFLLGPCWEHQRSSTIYTAPQCRFQIYQNFLAGGVVGVSYGNRYCALFDTNNNWESELNSVAANQIKNAKTVLEPLMTSMIPDQSLIVGSTGEITQGDSDTSWYYAKSTLIQAARTANSTNAIIYSAGGLDITVNMSKLASGTMSANWYNPRTGDWTFISNTIQSGLGAANVTFNPPDGKSEGNDWVLVLNLVAGPPTKIPAVYITNQNAIVSNSITDYSIGGTNNENVVGTMIWSNQLTLAGGNIPATPIWTISGIVLNPGDNVITVYGTNVYGNIAKASVTITRRYLPKIALRISDNKRFIVNTNGESVFLQCDVAATMPWSATTGDIFTYLNTRAAQGFNVIAIHAMDKNYDNDDDYATFENKAGYKPFQLQTSGSYTGRWDLTKPVESYWSFIDSIIDTAATQGLYVALAAIPVRGCILAGEAIRCMDRTDVNTAYAYGNWLGDRYADKTNIIWLAGFGQVGDPYNDVSTTVDAIAKGIADGVNGVSNNAGSTDYSTTLMGYTPERWTHSSSYWFHNEDWLDFNAVVEVPGGNTGTETFYQMDELTNDYALTPVKPTWLMGPIYENQRSDGSFNAVQSRFQAYQSVLAGGFGLSYGDQKVSDFVTNWNFYVTSDAGSQMHYLTDLISPVLADLVPDQSLLVGDTGEVTQGDSSSAWYWSESTLIQAARTVNSTNSIIYSAGGLDITVKMSKLASGTMSAYWYSPLSGSWTFISNTIDSGLASPNVTFNTPDLNDWVLVLNLEEIPEPALLLGGFLFVLAILRRR